MFATFANGFVYDFAVGSPLSYDACIDRNVYPYVAHRIGEIMEDFVAAGSIFVVLKGRTCEQLAGFYLSPRKMRTINDKSS